MASIAVPSLSLSHVSTCSFKLNRNSSLPFSTKHSFPSLTNPAFCPRLTCEAKLETVKKVTGSVPKQLATPADTEVSWESKPVDSLDTVKVTGEDGIKAEEETSENNATVESASAYLQVKKIKRVVESASAYLPVEKIVAALRRKFTAENCHDVCCNFFLCVYVTGARIIEAFSRLQQP